MADQSFPFTIEEASGQDPITVKLDGHDIPFGAPRKHSIFELGGENERHLINLDGRPTPIVHTRFTKWAPVVIKGHIRDHFDGEDGHGQAVVDALQAILDHQRLLNLSWGKWKWVAFPKTFHLPVEGLNDFTYELHFDILARPGQETPPERPPVVPHTYDFTADVIAALVEARVIMMAQAIMVTFRVALADAFTAANDSLTDTLEAALAFENAAASSFAEPSIMAAKAERAKASCDAILAELADAAPETHMTTTRTADVANFEAAVLETTLTVDESKRKMRAIQFTANQRTRAMTRIYKVAPGDTLDSIADGIDNFEGDDRGEATGKVAK